MYCLKHDDVDTAYRNLFRTLMREGRSTTRRDKEMVELSNVFWQLSNPRARVVQNPARKLSLPFLVGEFFWILAGSDEVDFISFYNKRMKNFSDDGFVLHGAYGKRLFDQWKPTIQKLRADEMTRQAVLTILSTDDAAVVTKDFPCNTTLFFSTDQDRKLNLTVTVRSQDMMLGFPYDVFHWTLFLENVAKSCDLEIGEYTHLMMNCHYYKSDEEKVKKIVSAGDFEHRVMDEVETSCFDDDFADRLLYLENLTRTNGMSCYNALECTNVWSDFLKVSYNRATNSNVKLRDGALRSLYARQ